MNQTIPLTTAPARAGPDDTPDDARPVLILTAGYGEGHNAAARALAEAFRRGTGPASAEVVDLFALASPRLNAATRRGYLALINRAPGLWRWFYARMDHPRTPAMVSGLLRRERRLLGEQLIRTRPAAVCCTYPLYAFLLNDLSRGGLRCPPVFNVVTDSISIHSLWWRAPCAGWFLPNDDSADVLLRAGIPRSRVHVSGFPVPPGFRAPLAPPELGPGVRPRVLHIINSGTRHAPETAARLLLETEWDITCAVGRNERLRRRLERLAANRAAPARILGWTDEMPQLLLTRHAVVSKAGGATTQEAIAAGCPMVISQVVPGQEEGNCELILRHGTGIVAREPAAVLSALHAAFADHGRVWRTWRQRLRRLARPDAAAQIARHVRQRSVETTPEP
jgi:processive 1,2-diacylglycerol beta-glucosyltransferase